MKITKNKIYDSNEEQYFADYLQELQNNDFVESFRKIYKNNFYLLTGCVEHNYLINRINNSEFKSQLLLDYHTYTPDFEIIWGEKAKNIFIDIFDIDNDKKLDTDLIIVQNETKGISFKMGLSSIIEIKGEFSKHRGMDIAVLNQKMFYQKYKRYVNIIKVPSIFKGTFTPESYLYTPTGRKKQLNYNPRTLEEFLTKQRDQEKFKNLF